MGGEYGCKLQFPVRLPTDCLRVDGAGKRYLSCQMPQMAINRPRPNPQPSNT
ncbi:hypothetical protein BLA6992_06649 [Burkholderia lata]|nr:hypothetical protein BLA6860_06365 [Burkholderia lata]VWM18044.1 hypothetical protein BLA6992_06649 [Burkholderia lata]